MVNFKRGQIGKTNFFPLNFPLNINKQQTDRKTGDQQKSETI